MEKEKCISTREIAMKDHSNKAYIKVTDAITIAVGIATVDNGITTSVKVKEFISGQMGQLTQDIIGII